MRVKSFFRVLRIFSVITLFFFCWSFLPLYAAVAYAAEKQGAGSRPDKIGAKGSGSADPSQSPLGKGGSRGVGTTSGDRFEKALEAIRENVSKAGDKADKGEDDAKEREIIKNKRAEIESADSEFRKEFAATEKKLKDAKLSQEILIRHYNFVRHYEDNFKELKTNLDDVEKATTKADRKAKITKAKAHLEKTKTPSKHVPLDPNKLPHRMVKGKERAPRLKKEEFEREFPPQRRQGTKTAGIMDAEGREWMRIALAATSTLLRSPLAKGGYGGSSSKPIRLSSNAPASDMPLDLSRHARGEGWGEGMLTQSNATLPDFVFPDSNLQSEISNSQLVLAQATVDLPMADDLAETPEVQFTPEIKAKAAELGDNPVKIYEWVRNNIKYEPYYGSLKGAQQTLLEGAGNDFDQASLLISLLRAINIPARYVYGTVEIPIERVANWLGVIDPIVAGTILSSNGIPVTLMKTSGGMYKTVRLEHCWVSVYVSMFPSFGTKNNSGNMMWVSLDPSFKEYKITTKVDLSKLAKFNETDYLSRRNTIPPSLSYLFEAEDYHTANYTGKIFEIFYTKRIIEENFEVFLGTLPYQIITTAQQLSEAPDTVRHKININLTDPAMGATASVQKNVAEITGKKITVSYKPATQEDETTINSYGGLLKTPAYLINVKPTVKVNDTVILVGPAVNLGASIKLSVNFIEPGMSTENIATDISAGIYYCISITALNPSQDQLSVKLDLLKSLLGSIYDSVNTRDEQIGELLHGISIEYFSKTNNAAKSLVSLMHIQNTNVTSGAFVSVRVAYANVFGIQSSPATITGLNLDVQRNIQSPFSITGDSDQRREFAQIQGLNSSFFEHSIMEMLTGLESISTVKALQIANETGMPTYKISSSNISAILPLLTVSQEVKTDIQNAVNAGKEVTISRDNVQLNSWSGVGFIVRDQTGAGAYMISGVSAGTDTTQPAGGALMLLSRSVAILAEGSPSNAWLSSNDLDLWEADMLFLDSIGGMLLGRGYFPIVAQTFSKQPLIDFANRRDVWLVYYSGHGGDGLLAPLPSAMFGYPTGVEPEYVFPSDIHADAHIAFLNSCSSAQSLDFMGAFGIDQTHQGQSRDEVFLGWTDSVLWKESGEFGFNWWRNMNDGRTAREAATRQNTVFTDYNTPGPKIRIEGNPGTTLY